MVLSDMKCSVHDRIQVVGLNPGWVEHMVC